MFLIHIRDGHCGILVCKEFEDSSLTRHWEPDAERRYALHPNANWIATQAKRKEPLGVIGHDARIRRGVVNC